MLKSKLKDLIVDFLSSRGIVVSKNFSRQLDKILGEVHLTDRVQRNFNRILENDYYISIYLEEENYLLKYLEVTLKISAFSNYLTDVMVRNPEFLTRFLSSGELHKNFSYDEFSQELEQQISIYKSYEKKLSAIRRFKRLHLLRIGLRDILNICELEQTMLEYSYLTQTILDKIFSISLEVNKAQTTRRKIPDYVLISLGKLGGLELNFSSDVDLICVYDNPAEKFSSDVLEFYDKVVKHFIQICTDTQDGSPLYRIDFRLRPDGKFSPLARSLSYYQIYYEAYGRDWERQMLLKMNFVSGSKDLFNRFYKSVENFVYPRSFLNSPQVLIQRFRKIYLDNLENDIETKDLNLKHFKGGIRDVEFSVQALQLLNGGRFNELRTPNTIQAIQKLVELKLIDATSGEKLINSYKFLRKIENFIQLMDDRQLHTIPQDDDKFLNLVKYLGLTNPNQFNNKLKSVRKFVQNFSEKVFETESSMETKKLFDRIKVTNREEFQRKFMQIFNQVVERIYSQLISVENYEIEKFKLNMINGLAESEAPEKVLSSLHKLTSNMQSSFQFVELVKNENLLKVLFTIFENSETLTLSLISDKKIIDAFFSGSFFRKPEFTIQEYSEDTFKIFIFHLMLNFLLENLSTKEVQYIITIFLDKLIQNLVKQKLKEFRINKSKFALIALGSYGTKELHFKSDLDLLFVFSDRVNLNRAEKFSQSLFLDLREKFKLYDGFQVDSKLRPEGKISKLSWTVSEFENYIHNRMRVWEFQSYTKARLIFGEQKIFSFLIELIQVRTQIMDRETVVKDIKKNRLTIKSEKISSVAQSLDLKNSNGGLMDLQFFIQEKIINLYFPDLLIGKSIWESLQILTLYEPSLVQYHKTLIDNYEKIFTLILFLQILTNKRGHILDKNFDSKILRRVFRIENSTSIFEHFENMLKENYDIIKKLSPEIF